MKTPDWLPVELPKKDGFKLVLSFEHEDMCARDHFMNTCEWSEEDYNSIKDYYWFTAKVTAYKGKIEAGTAHLGGNCYKSKTDFTNQELSHYLPQIIAEAVEEAKENLEIN